MHPEHRTLEGRANDNVRDHGADAIGWLVRRVSELELEPAYFDRTIDALLCSLRRRRADVEALQSTGRWPPR